MTKKKAKTKLTGDELRSKLAERARRMPWRQFSDSLLPDEQRLRFEVRSRGRGLGVPQGDFVTRKGLTRGEPWNPPEEWCFVEKQVPGCFSAWVETVGIRTEGMTFGVTGKPSRVIATDEGCYRPGYTGCRCRVFSGGTWQKRSHPVVECCARKTFGDGLHASDCSLTAPALGPQIEGHW
jgi:hypothetical protein